jgi:Fe-S oxidoreductase/nitrate reductase gamma subunit
MTTANHRISHPWKRIKDVLVYALGQARTVDKIYPGFMHLMIFWGVIIQIIGTAIKIMQMGLFVPFTWPLFSQPVYFGYELIMDLAGVAIILGVLMAAFRRAVIRPSYLKTSWSDVYTLVLLFLLPAVGFVTESFRLMAFDPAWDEWSFFGAVLADLLGSTGLTAASANAAHPYLFWVHAGLGLVFAASIPFTKLRHLFTTPAHIFFKTDRSLGELETIDDLMGADVLGAAAVKDFSSRDLLAFDACLQCGRCEAVCPPTIAGVGYSPRTLVVDLWDEMTAEMVTAQGNPEEQLPDLLRSEEFLWACTTCGACLDACPAFIRPPEHVVDIRRSQVLMTGDMPGMVGETLRNYERQGNPWGFPAPDRTGWIGELEVPVLNPGDEVEVLFYVGCAGSYDDRNQQVTRSFVSLLNKLDVSYGILGDQEKCCGETPRRMGNEYLFQMFAEENIALFDQYSFERIVTLCPHGLNTIQHEYPRFGGEYLVQHGVEYLQEILPENKFSPKIDLGTLTVHDSCYLGRYNQIYDQPRDLLEQAGQQVQELKETRADSYCCGGGGGAMWLETDADTRVNQTRLDQILAVDANTVSTNCPFCLIMLDDAVRVRGITEQVQILDLMEILDRSFD